MERGHRLLKRSARIEAVRVEDVDVVEPHSPQALVEAGEEVLSRSPLAVGPWPHVVPGLGGDHQLVSIGPEVLSEDATEVDLGRPVGRPVVVGQIDVCNAQIERPPENGPLYVERTIVAEVLPEAE